MESQEERRARFEREHAERRRIWRRNYTQWNNYKKMCIHAAKKGRPEPKVPTLQKVESPAEFWDRWNDFRNFFDGRTGEDERLKDWTEWKQLPPEEVAALGTKDHIKYCELWCAAHPINLEELEKIRKILLNEK